MEDKLKQGVEENIFSKSTPDPTEENKIFFRNVHVVLHNNRTNFKKNQHRDFFSGEEKIGRYINKEYLESLKGQKVGKTVIAAVHGGEVEALGGNGVTLNICLPDIAEAVYKGVNEPVKIGYPDEEEPDILFTTVFEKEK